MRMRMVVAFPHPDEPHQTAVVVRYRESHSVGTAVARKFGAVPASISEIAERVDDALGGNPTVIGPGTARAGPHRTQRQHGPLRAGAIDQRIYREEVGARHFRWYSSTRNAKQSFRNLEEHGGATAEREFLTLRSGDGVPQCGRSRRSDRGISRTDEGGSRLFRGIFPWRADAGAARPPGRGPRFVPRRD